MTDIFYKDKDARLIYAFDWSQWLSDGETIHNAFPDRDFQGDIK